MHGSAEATAVARKFSFIPFFTHSLEMLLHQTLEEEEDINSSDINSHDGGMLFSSLPAVINNSYFFVFVFAPTCNVKI